MDILHGILSVMEPSLLLYCLIGCLLGTLVGVLPGLGPASTMSILLPIVLYLNEPVGSIIMLAGLYYGAAYGGSTTSILTNIPGEVSSIPATFDGFPMTKQGRAGEALWIAAVGSFIAGTFGVLMLVVMGPGFARYALKFGPPEYFSLLLFSIVSLITLSGSSKAKGVAVAIFGMIIATVGPDEISGGQLRFDFGISDLQRGFHLIPVTVGLFGISEVLMSAEQGLAAIFKGKIGRMMPRGKELIKGLLAAIRGTLLGFPTGLLPGMAPPVASFMAYDLEKRLSRYPEKFGTGVIEGVAAPEAANNANAQAGFIPLFSFGIPTGPSPALILAAFTLYGLQPGPMLFLQHKDLVFTIIGSMFVGNVMLIILNLPLVGLWARISLVPYKYLAPVILAVCVMGAFSARNTMFDVWVAIGCGVLGYALRKGHWPIAPLILGLILGPMIETSLSQSLNMGGLSIFFLRPISVGFLIAAVVVIGIAVQLRKRVPAAALADESDG
jgi:putative tricarboxylic transport membrane protein